MPDSKEAGTEEASIAAYFTFVLVCAALVLAQRVVTLDLRRLSYFHLWLISQLILLTICVFYNLTKHVVAVQNPVDSWCDSLCEPSASHHHPAPEPERPPPPAVETGSSMDDTWKAIMERNRRPRKQIERAPVADSRELRKLAVAVKKDFASSKKKAGPAPAPALGPQRPERGEVRRRRDVLYDQSEMLIKKHYDYLRAQRQESEERRFFERLPQQSS